MCVCACVCEWVSETHRETKLDFLSRSNWTELGVSLYFSKSGCSISEVFASRGHHRETAFRSEMLVKPARQNGDKNDQETFTFMLQCIVIDFFLNNQQDPLIIQFLFCYKTLHVSGIFSVHHQEFSTVHSALVVSCRFLMTASKQSQDGTS